MKTLKPHNEERSDAARELADSLARTIRAYRKDGMTQRAMVDELNA